MATSWLNHNKNFCYIILRAEFRIQLLSPPETTQGPVLCTLKEGSAFKKHTCCRNSAPPSSGFIQPTLHNPRLNTHEGGSLMLILYSNAIPLNWLSFLPALLAPHQQHSSGENAELCAQRSPDFSLSPSNTRVGSFISIHRSLWIERRGCALTDCSFNL